MLSGTTEAIKSSAQEAEHSIANPSASTMETIRTGAQDAERTLNATSMGVSATIKQNSTEIERALATASTASIGSVAHQRRRGDPQAHGVVDRTQWRDQAPDLDAERSLSTVATGVTQALKQNATEIERTLLGVSAEVARGFTAKADELNSNINQRGNDLKRVLDEKTGVFLATFGTQGQKFSIEIERITQSAVQSIEAKGVNFSKAIVTNSEADRRA